MPKRVTSPESSSENLQIPSDGLIQREQDGSTSAYAVGKSHFANLPDVECLNPDANEDVRIYRKNFKIKRIYLPDELDTAQEALGSPDIVIGMTGYSSVKTDEWGIKPEAYEVACADILGNAILELQKEFPTIRVALVHGAAPMGVDLSVMDVAKGLRLSNLGFNCPLYMFYVDDDEGKVYVAKNKGEYSDAFIQGLNMLISVGGRAQALEHDISAAIRFRKRLVLFNLIEAISTTGGPPAWGPDGKVEDATAAFFHAIKMVSAVNPSPANGYYRGSRDEIAQDLVNYARTIIDPRLAFGRWGGTHSR
jgi:hypothetical protein